MSIIFSTPKSHATDYSALPKSSWNARLKEHKGGLGSIIIHPGGENKEISFHPLESGMWRQTFYHFFTIAAIQRSNGHKI